MQFKRWLEIKDVKHEYSCVMTVLNKEMVSEILKWSKENVKEESVFKEDDKGREDDPHVTLLYGLHTNDIKDVSSVLSKFKPFEIKFGKITKFDNPNYDVLKFDMTGSKLHEINKELKKLPHTSSFPIYHPHCTISYVKKGSCDHLLNNEDFVGKKSKISELTFSGATGNKSNIKLS